MENTDFKNLLKSAANVSKQISGFIAYSKTSKFKGQKYKTKWFNSEKVGDFNA